MSDLQQIHDEVKRCTKCKLCASRIQAVPGTGNPKTEILFIGEGPGKNEDEKGEPFVGQAGKLLDELLASINLKRADIFITNIVKCRPPNNRDPEEDEVKACTPYLDRQVQIIKPKLIVTLGRHSMGYFLPNLKISKEHGHPKRKNGQVYFPVYHPAAALYNGSLRQTLFNDFKLIPKLLKIIRVGNLEKTEMKQEEIKKTEH